MKKIVKGNKQGKGLSIFVKIMLVALVCMAVPLLITCIYSNNKTSSAMVKTSEESLETLAQSKSDAIDQFILAQKGICKSIATNNEIVNLCKTTEDPANIDSTERDRMSNYLLSITETEGDIYENIFFTVGSQTYANTIGNFDESLTDVTGEEFYETCLTDGEFFGSNVSPGSGLPVYVISYAITDPDTGDFLGVVNASISLSAMSQTIVNDEEHPELLVTLLDMTGEVVADADETQILNYNVASGDASSWNSLISSGSGYMSYADPSNEGKTKCMGYAVGEYYVCQVAEYTENFLGEINAVTRAVVVIMILALIVAAIIITIAIRNIIRPLTKSTNVVNHLVDEIAAGGGDLNTQVEVKTKDEVGQLGGSINQFISTLKDVMTMLRNESDKLMSVSESVSNSITSSEEEVSNVSATMEEMSASSEETAASLQQIVNNIEDVTNVVNDVYEQALKQVTASEQIKEQVSKMADVAIAETDASDREAKELVEQLSESIELAKKVENINALVDDILSITSQTNLLSLNASIEAARAGEAGKGFAVVADEISKLANDSADAASHIQQVSDEVIEAVRVLAGRAERMSQALMENNENSRVGTRRMSDSYAEAIDGIVQSMNEFADDSSHANQAMQDIKDAIDAINIAVDEMAQGVTNTTASVSGIASSLSSINDEAQINMDIAEEIFKEVSKYEM